MFLFPPILFSTLEGKFHAGRDFYLQGLPRAQPKVGVHPTFVERTNGNNKKWQGMNEDKA